jgi:hypothetical protein
MAALCGGGERLKTDALDLLEVQREVYVRRGRRALLEVLLRCGTATADNVREVVKLPSRINPKCFGSVPGLLAKLGIIRQAGFSKTCRAAGHSRPVAVWELVDRDAALMWLSDHPDTPEPAESLRQRNFLDQETATPAAGTVGAAR